jgi:hypothetical protein
MLGGARFSDVDALLSSYLASFRNHFPYQSSLTTMQNASGLWGKVKSQAQQAGSMAQGAMNVCRIPF